MIVWAARRNPRRFTMKRFRPVVGERSQQRGNDRLSGRRGSRRPASRIGRQANIRSCRVEYDLDEVVLLRR
jgi:hypothetical protein